MEEAKEIKLSKTLSVSAIFLGILGIIFSTIYVFLWGDYCLFWVFISIILVLAGIFDYYRADKKEKQDIQPPKQDRYCPSCGRSIPFDAKRCPYCSKDFDED